MINKDFNNRYYKSKVNQIFHTLYTTIVNNIPYVVFVWSDGFVGYSDIKVQLSLLAEGNIQVKKDLNENYITLQDYLNTLIDNADYYVQHLKELKELLDKA